jgi:hypothetical protein
VQDLREGWGAHMTFGLARPGPFAILHGATRSRRPRLRAMGTVLTLLGEPEGRRGAGLSEAAREAVVAAITGQAAPADPGPSGAAAALRASLDRAATLTPGERHLLGDLLDRIADERQRPTPPQGQVPGPARLMDGAQVAPRPRGPGTNGCGPLESRCVGRWKG